MKDYRYIVVDKDAVKAATNPGWSIETERRIDEQLKQIFNKWGLKMEEDEKVRKLELVPLCISFGWQAKDVAKMAERLSANLRLLGGPDLVKANDVAEVQADIVMLEFELREFSRVVTRLGRILMQGEHGQD